MRTQQRHRRAQTNSFISICKHPRSINPTTQPKSLLCSQLISATRDIKWALWEISERIAWSRLAPNHAVEGQSHVTPTPLSVPGHSPVLYWHQSSCRPSWPIGWSALGCWAGAVSPWGRRSRMVFCPTRGRGQAIHPDCWSGSLGAHHRAPQSNLTGRQWAKDNETQRKRAGYTRVHYFGCSVARRQAAWWLGRDSQANAKYKCCTINWS